MKKSFFVGIFLFGIILVSGCTQQDEQTPPIRDIQSEVNVISIDDVTTTVGPAEDCFSIAGVCADVTIEVSGNATGQEYTYFTVVYMYYPDDYTYYTSNGKQFISTAGEGFVEKYSPWAGTSGSIDTIRKPGDPANIKWTAHKQSSFGKGQQIMIVAELSGLESLDGGSTGTYAQDTIIITPFP